MLNNYILMKYVTFNTRLIYYNYEFFFWIEQTSETINILEIA